MERDTVLFRSIFKALFTKEMPTPERMDKVVISRKFVEIDECLLWNSFIQFMVYADPEQLSPVLKKCYLIYTYDSEVQNGGHDQFFSNCETLAFDEVIEALNFFKLNSFATILREAQNSRNTLICDEKFGNSTPGLMDELESILRSHEQEIVEWID